MGGIGRAIGGLFGSIFGGGESQISASVTPAPAPAVVAPPPVMPVPDDKAVKLAARQRLAKSNAGRTTRDSTILTGGDTDLLGG